MREWSSAPAQPMQLPTVRPPLPCVATIVAALLTMLLASGCDMSAAPVPATCSHLGAQCQVAGGVLGVCENIACDAGQTPPCFRCVDQH